MHQNHQNVASCKPKENHKFHRCLHLQRLYVMNWVRDNMWGWILDTSQIYN